VQTNSVRNNFAYFFNFPINKIHVISPKFNPLTINQGEQPSLKCDEDRLNIFYPATTFPYKNHQIILNALNKIDLELGKLITLHLTCKRSDLKYLEPLFHNININFLGEISHSKVFETYLRSDALLFPSYIETYGLPLIEAASLGIPIIVADLPYAREVLMDYEGVKFVPYDNIQLWKDEIIRLFDFKGKRYSPHVAKDADSWTKLFKIVKNKIHNNVQQ
jgi:glycosyltransferase involved in cell wall biosynthesis